MEDIDDVIEEHAEHLKPHEVAIHTEVDNRMMARQSVLDVAKVEFTADGLVMHDTPEANVARKRLSTVGAPPKRMSLKMNNAAPDLEKPLLGEEADEALEYKDIVAVHDMGDKTLQVEVKAAFGDTMTVTMEAGSS